ncbi:DUF1430 domain-containing protein [Vagococcus intermedius]|uniref:DUF1430 domain-containing protein n=1 Tax=Vagococcus intermedius TaxID=2991418 RepID=A0AAF0I9J2_9ENTE|nr:DUF1430 domain-containing protein [Vagococcus intermedius]WEG73487.1 DUF1430 domain-containing protein [Vagococcus intermedius]WEG75571.1 DUF1430 domain-containing protein [Vagococcus intermedius]
MKIKMFKSSLLLLLLSLLFGIVIFQLEHYSLNKINHFFRYTDNYSPIKIPVKVTNTNENEKVITIIDNVSKEKKLVNLYKVVNQGYSIKEGFNFTFLPKQEITLYIPNTNKKMTDTPPLSNALLSIETSDNLKSKNEFEWQLFIKTTDKTRYKDAVESLKNLYNREFNVSYTYQDFADFDKSQSYDLGIDTDLYNISTYLKIGIVFFTVMLSFWIFSVNSKIHILRQNGYSIVAIINNLIGGKSAIFIFTSIGLVTSLLGTISIRYCIDVTIIIGLLLSFHYSWLIIMVYVVEKLNRRKKDSQNKIEKFGINLLPTTIKLIFLMMLVITNIDLASIIDQASDLTLNKEVSRQVTEDNYHVFFPIVVGKNQIDFLYDQYYGEEEEGHIYRYLNQKGSLLVNIEGYSFKENEIFAREIQLNPNYLKKFTILDEHNQRVLIEEDQKNRILLIQEKFKKNDAALNKIKEYYFKELPQYDKKLTTIIYIKDKQPIYSFVPNHPWIDDYPILNILTIKNSDSWERNIFNGDKYPPLKIKTDKKLISDLNVILDKYNMTDNLPSFIPYHKSDITLIKRLSGSLASLLTSSLLTIFTFSIVCLLTTVSFFQYHNKKFYLLRLHGYSFFKTYELVFLLVAFELIIGLSLAIFLSEINKEFIINISLAMLLNISIVSMTLLFVEKRKVN